jgi:N-acetylglutamate synthase-like GNAT family acetyltransferase
MSTPATTIDSKAISEGKDWDLSFVKVRIPENVRLIPKELIENVKGRTFSPEQFLKYQEEQIRYENPGNLLFLLISPNKNIEGYLWAEISQLDGTMFINTFSISKDYWFKGKAIPKVIEHLRPIQNKLKCSRVFWITTNDKFFTKHGFKRSKNVLMEFCDN